MNLYHLPTRREPGPDEFRINVELCANCGADFLEHNIDDGKILCPKAEAPDDCQCQTAGPHLCPTDDRPFVALCPECGESVEDHVDELRLGWMACPRDVVVVDQDGTPTGEEV